MITQRERSEIAIQIEQIKSFLDSVYAGMAYDIEIRWNFRGGLDSIGREIKQETADYWRDRYGKHEKITIGVGDAYYGSKSVSHMLYGLAYEMRERLVAKLEDVDRPRTMMDLYDQQ